MSLSGASARFLTIPQPNGVKTATKFYAPYLLSNHEVTISYESALGKQIGRQHER
jgi:hypothetical protein